MPADLLLQAVWNVLPFWVLCRSRPLADLTTWSSMRVPSSTIKGAEGEEERALAPHDPPTPEGALPLSTKLTREQSWHTHWEVLSALVKMTEQGALARVPPRYQPRSQPPLDSR